MKYIKQLLLGIVLMSSGFCSCDYLNVDDYFLDTFIYDSIFSNKSNLERYLWNIPTFFKDEGAFYGASATPGVSATDECIPTWDADDFRGMRYVRGLYTADTEHPFWIMWKDMYRIVRKVNYVIQNIESVPDLSTQDKRDMLGYAYFMRAYAYYNVLVDYGPLLLLGDDVISLNEDMSYYDRSRATFDESVEYVCGEFEKAAKYMPRKEDLTLTQLQAGRPSRDAALGLVARLRLIHASNAYNGGDAAKRYFGDWKRSSDGVNYVSQTPDNRRWAVAAHAAKRLIDKEYVLHTVPRDKDTPELPPNVPTADFPNGAGGIDPYKSYKDIFTGEAIPYKNQENIWAKPSAILADYIRRSFPWGTLQGWGGLGVPQKIVDAFYMADGTDYENAGVNEKATMGSGKEFSGYKLLSGTSEMYNNREVRFYANIGFQNRLWPCLSTTDNSRNNFVANYAMDGNCGKAACSPSSDYTLTGYVTVKYIHDDDAYAGNGAVVLSKSFAIIRYAEILLSYAEALNNIDGSYTISDEDGEESVTYTRDYNEISRCINQVRFRVGLPSIPQGLSKDEMNKLIQRERLLELFHENRRYYDVRRWGIYDRVDAEPIIGMNINAPSRNFFERVQINHINVKTRIVSPRLVLLPIWKNELRIMPSLDQNPGWSK